MQSDCLTVAYTDQQDAAFPPTCLVQTGFIYWEIMILNMQDDVTHCLGLYMNTHTASLKKSTVFFVFLRHILFYKQSEFSFTWSWRLRVRSEKTSFPPHLPSAFDRNVDRCTDVRTAVQSRNERWREMETKPQRSELQSERSLKRWSVFVTVLKCGSNLQWKIRRMMMGKKKTGRMLSLSLTVSFLAQHLQLSRE